MRAVHIGGVRLAAGRVGMTALGLVLAVIAGLQYEKVVERNVALSHDLAATRAQIATLRDRERKQLRTIERLSDPAGAVPEIHDRLRFVGPREELIFVKPATPAPVPRERLR